MRDYSRFKITVKGEPKFALSFLNLGDARLKKLIGDVLDTLKEHPDAGDLVEHALWPDEYERLALDNLFRIEVGRGKRMTYTIRIEGVNLMSTSSSSSGRTRNARGGSTINGA